MAQRQTYSFVMARDYVWTKAEVLAPGEFRTFTYIPPEVIVQTS